MPILQGVYYLYPLNTQVLNIVGLTDVVSGIYLNSATVTATLYDQRGTADPVLNGIILTYLPATNGNYQGTVPATFSPPAWTGQASLGGYTLKIQADQASVQALFTLRVILKARSDQ